MPALASPLQARILTQLQDRFGSDAALGQRLNEAEIAEWLGVSRTPVREVLRNLERDGILSYEHRRGFQLLRPLSTDTVTGGEDATELLDERVMREMALGTLNAVMSERALIQRFAVPRGFLVSTLRRLMRDQLVEPSPGRGWIFADVGPEALKDGYKFRQFVEPAAILSDGYRVDAAALSALDREHAAALDDIERMDRRTLFELDARFHIAVASGAGTRHLSDAIARQNNIRRVNEYIGFIRLERVQQSMIEHRQIMAALRAGKNQIAAALMRLHLDISEQETFAHMEDDLARLRSSDTLLDEPPDRTEPGTGAREAGGPTGSPTARKRRESSRPHSPQRK